MKATLADLDLAVRILLEHKALVAAGADPRAALCELLEAAGLNAEVVRAALEGE